MRRLLFETYSAPAYHAPRIQPNLFAKLARFSFRHPVAVFMAWIILCAGMTVMGFTVHKFSSQIPLDVSAELPSVQNFAELKKYFPNLDKLIALNISNDDTEKLQTDRANLVARIDENKDLFTLAFSPGSGSYYESHAILYHPLAEIKARVAYAQSLRPLFDAISAAPTTQSLATLVNEVSASIEMGRDPQGLDALFSEAAKSVRALIDGKEKLVDWTVVAGLNVDPQPTSSLVFILPQPDQAPAALAFLKTLLDTYPRAAGTTTFMDQIPAAVTLAEPKKTPQIFPAILMAVIFLFFALLILLGHFTLCAAILLPLIATEAVLIGAMLVLMPQHMMDLWPMIVAVAIFSIQLSSRQIFAVLEALKLGRGKKIAVMLAAQKQGKGIVMLTFLFAAVWASWIGAFNEDLAVIAPVVASSTIIALLSSLMILPALLKLSSGEIVWRAEEWLVPGYQKLFENRIWRTLRVALTFFAVIIAAAGFWLAPSIQLASAGQHPEDAAVNILAGSPDEAETLVKALTKIPEAHSVRWLGAFLPQQVDEKLASLQSLKENFSRVTPLIAQDSEIQREHIGTLQESLLAIANSPATRPELRAAAQELRGSLELLSATSDDTAVRALDNRLFGSFNVLPGRADELASLDKPRLETLDPQLKALFVSSENQFRLEVTPVPQKSNTALAHVLALNGFKVAHPSLVFEQSERNLKHIVFNVLGIIAAVSVLGMVWTTREFAGFVAGIFTLVMISGILAAAIYLLKIPATDDQLIFFVLIAGFADVVIFTFFTKRHVSDNAVPDAVHAIEAWIPSVLLGAATLPVLFIAFDPYAGILVLLLASLVTITSIVSFLLRPITIFLRDQF